LKHFVTRKIKIYETVILPVVLYGCETWSFTLKEEHRLRVSENRVFRRIKKVKLSLGLTKHHAMKTYWWSGGIAPCILDLGTRWR
jgi:hypothetical protein